jgi:nitrous oxide reductase accessory protein NosL
MSVTHQAAPPREDRQLCSVCGVVLLEHPAPNGRWWKTGSFVRVTTTNVKITRQVLSVTEAPEDFCLHQKKRNEVVPR